MPTTENTAPTGSSGACWGSRELGTRNRPATRATVMMGTLMKKIDPYQKWPSSQPLIGGPIAPAAPVKLAQIAIALTRSSGGNTLIRIESVDGMISAPAAPMTARQAISCHIAVDSVAAPAPARYRA